MTIHVKPISTNITDAYTCFAVTATTDNPDGSWLSDSVIAGVGQDRSILQSSRGGLPNLA